MDSVVQQNRESLEGQLTRDWPTKAFWPIIIATILYLPIVFGLKKYFANRQPYAGRAPLVAWNFTLAFFSALGSFCFVFLSDPRNLVKRNVGYFEHTLPANITLSLFCLTKCVEYGDTFLLCIKKRPTIFLHLYHHVTVALYCLHAIYYQAPYGHIFAFVNLNIHAIMYTYYGLAIMERTKRHWMMRKVRPYITSMQLTQMFLGTGIAYVECIWPIHDDPNLKRDRTLALVMYISYAYLFGDFWLKNYTNSAPLRSLLGCTPIAVLTMCLPLLFQDVRQVEVSPLSMLQFLAITVTIMQSMKMVGKDERLRMRGMIFPMAACATDFNTVKYNEDKPNKSIALFAKGQSACVDFIRYTTLPSCILVFACNYSPIHVIDLPMGLTFLTLSALWLASGVMQGSFFAADRHMYRVNKGVDNVSSVANDEKENIAVAVGKSQIVSEEDAANLSCNDEEECTTRGGEDSSDTTEHHDESRDEVSEKQGIEQEATFYQEQTQEAM